MRLKLSPEIASLVSSYTPRNSPLRTLLRPSPFLRRTHSPALPRDFAFPLAATSTPATPATVLAASPFERSNDDYLHLPPSSLDHPYSPPRSPQQALLSLIRDDDYSQADALLTELLSTNQPVEPHPLFARVAERFLAENLNSNWLNWYRLVPHIATVQSKASSYARYVLISKVSRARTARMLVLLMEDSANFDRLLEFGKVAATQDDYQRASRRLLAHFAAFAPMNMAETLFDSCLEATEVIRDGKVAHVEERALSDIGMGWMWPALNVPGKTFKTRAQIVEGVVEERVNRYTEAVRLLHEKRGQMLRIIADRGHLKKAVKLIQSSTLPINKLTYCYLLDIAASLDQYSLFEPLYAGLEASGGRLERAQNPSLSGRRHFFTRSIDSTPSVPSLAPANAREAFVALRYADYKNPIVEDNPDNSVSDAKLRAALDADDFPAAATELKSCHISGTRPRLDIAADFVTMARQGGHRDFSNTLVGGPRIVLSPAHTTNWERSYWANAGMLSHIRTKEWKLACRIFVAVFELAGLPESVRALLQPMRKSWGEEYRKNGLVEQEKVAPSPQSLAILFQALVKLAVESGMDHGGLTQLYQAVLAHPFEVGRIGSHRRTTPGSTAPSSSSSLNSYIFLPFLQAFANDRRPATELLDALVEIQSAGFTLAREHWGIVLGAFASNGPISSLDYLLDTLEHGHDQPGPTPELTEKISRLILPSEKPDRVAYTSCIAGLGSRGEYQMAMILHGRLEQVSLGSDARLERVVELVKYKGAKLMGGTERW